MFRTIPRTTSFIFTAVQVTHDALGSGAQQHDSATYTQSFFLRFLSHRGYHRILSRVPWAIQQVLVGLPVLCGAVGVCSSQAPDSSLPCHASLLVRVHLFPISVSPFPFCKSVHLYQF